MATAAPEPTPVHTPPRPLAETAAHQREAGRLLDLFIRGGLLLALVLVCWQVFAPFATLSLWAVILAVTLAGTHHTLARRLGLGDGSAASLLVVLGLALVVAPTGFIAQALADSVHQLVSMLREDGFSLPPPPPGIADWPVVGHRLETVWTRAHADLPGLMAGLKPKLMEYARPVLGFAAGIGLGILQFMAAFVLAGVLLAWRKAGTRAGQALLVRVAGPEPGRELLQVVTQTLQAVAQGVIGVAMIQAILVGLCLIAAGIPWAGVLAGVVLVLGIAQLPALLVTLPAIAYLWMGDQHSPLMAGVFTGLLLVGGMADNILKPFLLGRGSDVPMPVVLIGALGGAASGGILGIFVGAAVLALGWRLLTRWVDG